MSFASSRDHQLKVEMKEILETSSARLVKTVKNWHPARAVFSEFITAHPELGLKDSPITFRNFCCRHGRALMELDVMRKPSGLRSPAIFDAERFDGTAFELMTNRLAHASNFSVEEAGQC